MAVFDFDDYVSNLGVINPKVETVFQATGEPHVQKKDPSSITLPGRRTTFPNLAIWRIANHHRARSPAIGAAVQRVCLAALALFY
jgi:hypothetical protein